MELGARIRKIRLAQQRTLAEVAEQAGFTRSLLSKIENGHSQPPVATLTKIATALGIKAAALLDDGDATGTQVDRGAGVDPAALAATDEGYRFFAFAAARSDKSMQPYLFEARRGEIKQHSLSHAGEEFVYVLDGSMRYRVGDTEYLLAAGDAVYFDSEQEHALEPISETVRYLGIFVDPQSATSTAGRRGKKVSCHD